MTPLEVPHPPLDTAEIPAPPNLAKLPPPARPAPPVRKRHLITGAILLALVCAWLLGTLRKAAGHGGPASTLPVVAVAKVERRNLAQTLTISAEFRPYQQVVVHSKIAGYLQTIGVDLGDHVRESQTIAQLDVPELKDDLEKAIAAVGASEQDVARAEADFNEAHLACLRLQDVAKQHPKLVAGQDLDSVQARDAAAAGTLAAAKQKVAEANAEVGKVRSMIAYTTISAPFDGVITKRFVDPGALVQAGTSSSSQAPVVEIAEDKRLRLAFPVPESAVPLVQVGAPARVTIPSLGETIDAKVTRFSGKVDRATRTMSTEVDIDNRAGRVKPGMYARVELVVRESKGVVTVPVQAVAGGEKPRVLAIADGGTVVERNVRLGLETPSAAEVISGLAPGDLVIIGSRSGVQSGQKVAPRLIEATRTE